MDLLKLGIVSIIARIHIMLFVFVSICLVGYNSLIFAAHMPEVAMYLFSMFLYMETIFFAVVRGDPIRARCGIFASGASRYAIWRCHVSPRTVTGGDVLRRLTFSYVRKHKIASYGVKKRTPSTLRIVRSGKFDAWAFLSGRRRISTRCADLSSLLAGL